MEKGYNGSSARPGTIVRPGRGPEPVLSDHVSRVATDSDPHGCRSRSSRATFRTLITTSLPVVSRYRSSIIDRCSGPSRGHLTGSFRPYILSLRPTVSLDLRIVHRPVVGSVRYGRARRVRGRRAALQIGSGSDDEPRLALGTSVDEENCLGHDPSSSLEVVGVAAACEWGSRTERHYHVPVTKSPDEGRVDTPHIHYHRS